MASNMGGETEYPRQHSTIINRVDVSNPEEDNARERAREAEAQGLQVINSEGQPAAYSSPPSSSQKRQDFSNEKVSRRDTRLGNYILGKTLGEGEFGKVKLGWKQGGSTSVAVKIIRKEKLNDKTRLEKVNREVRILQDLDHPNIVRLHEMVETDRTMGIVLEYAPNGELFNFILNSRFLKDENAKRLFAQLVSAVGYLHRMGIIHRDLKLENLLLDRNHNIIVTDFGFANRFDPDDDLGDDIQTNLNDRKFVSKYRLNELDSRGLRRGDLMATSCGSPCYAAPELVISDGLYTGRKVDVWSVGVILYAMLAGYLPYDDDPRNPDGDNINLLYSYISETELKFPDYVTPHARDLLKRILVPDPRTRAELFEVARHSWLLGFESVVEAITSTTSPSLISGSAFSAGQSGSTLTRSASARNASSSSAPTMTGGLIPKRQDIGQATETPKAKSTPREHKRQTVQVEYMPPRQAQQDGRDDSGLGMSQQDRYAEDAYNASLGGQYGGEEDLNRGEFPTPIVQPTKPVAPPKVSMPPVSRHVPRSVTDPNLGSLSTSRPPTQGSMTGTRLPSRGSYGQPAAAQVATTSAQGHFAQPRPTGSAPYGSVATNGQPQSGAQDFASYPTGRPSSQQPYAPPGVARTKRGHGHSRSQTLSDLTQRVFGRSSSTKRTAERRPKPDRAYPPTSMKPVDSPTTSSRKSSDSRPSFAGGRKSTEFNAANPKRTSRRFSFLPWSSSKPDLTRPQTNDREEPVPRHNLYSPAQLDGASDVRQQTRPPPSSPPVSYQQQRQQPLSAYPPSANNINPQYRVGSAMSQQSYQDPYGSQVDAPSRFDTPASMPYERREKPPYEIENMSASKKMGRGGPAQRVMDFFSGRRKRQGGMAA